MPGALWILSMLKSCRLTPPNIPNDAGESGIRPVSLCLHHHFTSEHSRTESPAPPGPGLECAEASAGSFSAGKRTGRMSIKEIAIVVIVLVAGGVGYVIRDELKLVWDATWNLLKTFYQFVRSLAIQIVQLLGLLWIQ